MDTFDMSENDLKKMQDFSKNLRVLEYAKYALSGCIAAAPNDYTKREIISEAFDLAEVFEEERARREDAK